MKCRLNNLFLTFVVALGLFAAYGLTQQSLAQETTEEQKDSIDQETNDDEDGAVDGEINDDAETSEVEGTEADQHPAAIESFGSVTIEDAVKTAQTELGSSTSPFEVTLEQVSGQLVWLDA